MDSAMKENGGVVVTYQESIEYILDIPKFTTKNSLEQTRAFLKYLGEPAKGKKVLHVAGTNGKGSVCAYMQAILLVEKKTVGLFTSPHLVSMNERIRINGIQITEEEFLRQFHKVREAVIKMKENGLPHPTFFEFLYGMAMTAFEQAEVEYIILETGLGGRLDATNTIEQPILTILTSISLDHMEILGTTIEQIAYEKAGILKPNVPAICDAGDSKVVEVIRKQANLVGTTCREITNCAYEIIENHGKDIAFLSTNAYYEDITWKLSGGAVYQVMNATLALEAMYLLFKDKKIDKKRWKDAIAEVQWEGRMEEIAPGVIVDGAHNPAAIRAFVQSVSKATVILFSAVKEKEYQQMIKELCQQVETDVYVVTSIPGERGVPAHELAQIMKQYTTSEIVTEEVFEQAVVKALEIKGEHGTMYGLGSLYLVGMLKTMI